MKNLKFGLFEVFTKPFWVFTNLKYLGFGTSFSALGNIDTKRWSGVM